MFWTGILIIALIAIPAVTSLFVSAKHLGMVIDIGLAGFAVAFLIAFSGRSIFTG